MNILILEDNQQDLENLQTLIHILFVKKDIKYSITTSNCFSKFYDKLDKFDLIFLDVELDKENGIEIGQNVKSNVYSPRIIITSHYQKYLIEGYKVHAERFFIKPISQETFEMEMHNVLCDYFSMHLSLYDPKISRSKILIHTILYIEYINRKSYVHLTNGESLESTYSLKQWKEKLSDFAFAQPHKSFIVNFQNISSISDKEVILSDDTSITLSRFYHDEFERLYVRYLHGVM